jgi:predicted AlkP superfamily pyrophosphatase or phosphodiesterase
VTRPILRLVAILAALAIAAALPNAPSAAGGRIVVLVSFDGWRWDYSERLPAPNLRALASRGVRAREMIPSFPVLTFPNHYTIVTGLYPEHHGIVANNIVDPANPVRFSMTAREAVRDSQWWGGEPVWVTAGRQGLRTAPMFWPGSETAIRGELPTYWIPFEGAMPADARVVRLLDWLRLPEAERPSFLTLYFDDVDHAGHDFGPESPELRAAVARVDRALGALVSAIARLGLQDRTDVVVVSDHGMAALSPDRIILLDDYVDVSELDITETNGFLALAPIDRTPANIDRVYSRLVHAHPRLRVFTRETVPAQLHYRDNPRIAPIIGIPDAGWMVTTRALRERRLRDERKPPAGAHGFLPADRVMHAIFVAAGPGIRRGLVVPSVENIQIYNFLCALLGLTPAPNDGDAARVSAWLQRSP